MYCLAGYYDQQCKARINLVNYLCLKHEPLFLFFDSKSAASKLSALSLGWMLKALDIAFTFHDLNDPSAIARVDISPDQSPVFIGFLRGVTDESIRLFQLAGFALILTGIFVTSRYRRATPVTATTAAKQPAAE